MHVAGEIEVVETGLLEHRRLLRAHVRRQEENRVARVLPVECGASASELIGDNRRILVSEVALLDDEVALRLAADPSDQLRDEWVG